MPAHLAGSLQETMEFLKRERPDDVEAGHLRVAIERSLLDSAVQLCTVSRGGAPSAPGTHERALGVAPGASQQEVRSAYRAKARALHPDKGGDHQEFCRLQKAYLALTSGSKVQQVDDVQFALPAASDGDFQLQCHRELAKRLFCTDGVDLDECRARQATALSALGLEISEQGAVNTNEQGKTMNNQCFYLSLARSYLGDAHTDPAVKETALSLKRVIEAAVLEAHPDWAECRVGENVQAFGDFLFFVLGTHALLSEVAVVIVDEVTGGAELYVGRNFPTAERSAENRANTLIVQYVPGHYRSIVPIGGDSQRPGIDELKDAFDAAGVLYTETNRW